MRDFPTIQANRQVEEIEQMFNMDEDKTILQTPLMDVDQVRQSISPCRSYGKFKLVKGKNDPTAFFAFRFQSRWK